MFGGRVRTRVSTRAAVEEEIAGADVVIGAVLVPGASAPRLVTRDMLGLMKRGSVVVDVAIDQGGCFETSRPRSEEHTSELQSLMRISYAVFCLKKKKKRKDNYTKVSRQNTKANNNISSITN